MEQHFFPCSVESRRESMSRRGLLESLSLLVGAGTLTSLSELKAQIVPKEDARLQTGYIEYPTEKGKMRAYSARLKGEKKLPAMIVIHENRGLNAHIEDVARRVALEGYLTIAPDALSPLGGTPANPDDARGLFAKLDRAENIGNFTAAVKYLKTHPQSTGKVGCTGFCWGGAVTNQVAVHAPELNAAVPFYGSQPATEDVPRIKAALMLHYAGNDERINAGIAAFEEALKKASIAYKLFMYEGAGHAFFNDSNPSRYHKEAAELAWQRTLEFLKEKLKT